MEKQFTVSAYIFKEEQVLLHPHPKLKIWLPPGGHVEANETLDEAIKREVFEETGLLIKLITDDPLSIHESNARSIPRPYLCLLEEIPTYKDQAAHQHIDFVYRAVPIEDEERLPLVPFEWVPLSDLDRFLEEGKLFMESYQVIRQIQLEGLPV